GVAERARREPIQLARVGRVGLADVAFAGQSTNRHTPRCTRRMSAGFKPCLEFPDLEDFGAAVRANSLDRGATVFHGHLLGVFDLDLLALFDAVALRHRWISFRCRWRQGSRPSGREMDCGECNGGRGRSAAIYVRISTNRPRIKALIPLLFLAAWLRFRAFLR